MPHEAIIRTILHWEHPRLSMICEKVADHEFGPQLEGLEQDLLVTTGKANGLGLAAPQVDILKAVFVMQFPISGKPSHLVCNPELILSGRAVPKREGCLSLPDIHEQVVRAEKVKMTYRTALGVAQEIELTDLDARIAQHETDHLWGIMFFDYQDKRPTYGARMSKQMSKQVLRRWEKARAKREQK